MIDYDLRSCLTYNPQEGLTEHDIREVLAIWEGENDQADWHWVVHLRDGRYAYITGGCDYTGWDCISSASSTIFPGDPVLFLSSHGAYTVLDGEGALIPVEIVADLIRQCDQGKHQTWRERKDTEFGVVSGVWEPS